MEAYFMTRGKNDEVEEFVKWLSTRALPFPIKNGDGSVTQSVVECQIRPVQLWSFVFPREQKDLVVNSLGLYHEGNMFVNGYNINLKVLALRKLLGASAIEKPKDVIITMPDGTKKMMPYTDKMFLPYYRWKDVNIIGIGIREDGDIAATTHERI